MEEPEEILFPLPPYPTVEAVSSEPSLPVATTGSKEVVYKVQFMTSTQRLKANAREFKGITDYETYQQKNIICYTTGRFSSAREAAEYQKTIREKGFSDAFVVAFQGEERITMQKAKEINGK